MAIRRKLEVAGIVQGVGFRPFVYRLARDRRLAGTIRNTPAGVVIEIQGVPEAVKDFQAHLTLETPPLARITKVIAQDLECNAETEFRILASHGDDKVQTLISPDVAVCADCLRELFDPSDRRYRYPFINCTNCGPRFTIVRDIPYDRARTSMSMFPMCAACQAEYDDPLDRRFHAQPNACWECGPRVELWDREGRAMECEDPIAQAAKALHNGHIVAVKGLGGFHLAALATDAAAVRLLRDRKRRVEKPFAVMVRDAATASAICSLGVAGRAALDGRQRPIILLPRNPTCGLPDEIAPSNRYLGIFLPYTPLHYLLLDRGPFQALVMTSGNLSEEPISIENQEAVYRLRNLADFFLVHNRDILLRCDDSVVRPVRGQVRQLRRSRGFVPVPVFLKDEQPSVLAVGGELKNTICLTRANHAFLSQHVGGLENEEGHKFFEEAVGHLKNVLEIDPQILACDLHPDYFSTRWAMRQKGLQRIGVQHHHAHIASCMAENHLDGPVIGMAFDGTGYGTDGKIWGGEVLFADFHGFERLAHLEYVPMPGGTAAIREPWRMAVSYLAHHFGPAFLDLPIPFVRQLEPRKVETLLRMIARGINSPLTSSCGRLFDAVAALVGVRQRVTYEAQAAIELEMLLHDSDDDGSYEFTLLEQDGGVVIGTGVLFNAIVADLSRSVHPGNISRRFHNGLAGILTRIGKLARKKTGTARVCLSGGTFNNVYLTEKLESNLISEGFEVFSQSEVPAGDGGLSLGQAIVAAHVARPPRGHRQHARL
ncbi:MAG TPA: carbamoyltransferase HypF [Terriglobales bacterium]